MKLKLTFMLFVIISVFQVSLEVRLLNTQVSASSSSNNSFNSSLSSNDLRNLTVIECFHDTVGNMVNRLQQSTVHYSNLCNINNKPKINRLIMVSRYVALIEAYSDVALNQLPANVSEVIKALDQFNEFRFSSYLLSLQDSLRKGENSTQIIKNFWTALKDEMESISKANNYPFFFTQNLQTLIQLERAIIILKERYSKQMDSCVPNDWQEIIQVRDLFHDQNHNLIYRSESGVNRIDAYDVPINPTSFERGGVAFAFWGYENYVDLQNAPKSILAGYINNNRVYEYFLIPQNLTVIHRLRVFDVIFLLNLVKLRNCVQFKL